MAAIRGLALALCLLCMLSIVSAKNMTEHRGRRRCKCRPCRPACTRAAEERWYINKRGCPVCKCVTKCPCDCPVCDCGQKRESFFDENGCKQWRCETECPTSGCPTECPPGQKAKYFTDEKGCKQCECRNCTVFKGDIVFVLDSSSSVGSPNFQIVTQFVHDVVKTSFKIGEKKVRVGVMKYSTSPSTPEFHLKDFFDKASMLPEILSITYIGGTTATGEALEVMRKTMFKTSNGDREKAPNIGIVITDGRSNNNAKTVLEADEARKDGVELIAIGIGSASQSELKEIASDPDSEHVFSVKNFTGLPSIMNGLICACDSSKKAANGG